jgi:predicted SAM-dependent methyltransferase
MVQALVKRRLSPPLRFAIRRVLDELKIDRVHRASLRKARRLPTNGALRLNLASGCHPKRDWINVDLFAPTADLRLDLRRPFPFPDNSVDRIYVEHFFEHLEYPNVDESMGWKFETPESPSQALSFLRECWRVLAPDGVLDLVVPDAELLIGEYVNRRGEGPMAGWWGPKWCDTAMHCVNYLFRQGREHKYAYDEETLKRVLQTARFVEITRRDFDPLTDDPSHAIGSLCMLGRKPRRPE